MDIAARPKPSASSSEYELLEQRDLHAQHHYNLANDSAVTPYQTHVTPPHPSSIPVARRGFWHTVWSNRATLIALPLGIAGSIACFGFTYWLSKQTFVCQPWALYCEVPNNVEWMARHLGQVQGFVSALYSVFLSMIAYVAFKLAETNLWPAMTHRSFTMSDIDKFLEITRGSVPAFPRALWHSFRGGFYHSTTVLLAGCLALLLFFNSIFVGHAYTVDLVPTGYLSNFTMGAGIGFGFSQSNPPGSFPSSIGQAYAVYTAWANNMTAEPLPELRDYILDRATISKIGNATVNAVKASRHVNCSAIPIRITRDVRFTSRLGDSNFQVATHIPDSGDSEDSDFYDLNNDHDEDGYMDVSVRIEPYLAVWVDQYHNTSATGATTRLVFAAINGTIEGGHHTPPTDTMKVWLESDSAPHYTGIDTLTCDVAIDLVDSQACIGPCTDTNVTLSSLETLDSSDLNGNRWETGTRYLWSLAVWLAVMPSTLGTSVFGNQPLFTEGPTLNSSLALPVAWTSTDTREAMHWSQANITNFIDVAAGAFGITLTHSFPLNETANATVVSELETPRLRTDRSWILLVPIFVAVLMVLMLSLLSVLAYAAAHVRDVRMGRVADLVVSVQTAGMRGMIDQVRRGEISLAAMEEVQLRYGVVPDGHDGLGVKGEVQALSGVVR